MNKLWGMRVYLCGPIDAAEDLGQGWRNQLTPWLHERGLVVLNPMQKPIDIGIEDAVHLVKRRELKQAGRFSEFAREMRIIRSVDLRMCDMSDFIIVNLDLNIPSCGTWEEVFWTNRMKKPSLVNVVQDRTNVPDWMIGTIPHEFIFSHMNWLKAYLHLVDVGADKRTFNRWMFFDYQEMVPKVPVGYLEGAVDVA
jgi:hypothetical protein